MNQRHGILRAITVVSLLGCYLAAVIVTNLHVSLGHQHDAREQCTDESESNACHRAIYHHDQEGGCQHPGHLSTAHHDCELCDAICAFQPPLVDADTDLVISMSSEETSLTYLLYGDQNLGLLCPARGPPMA
ncbi:MAG: hypothetical protein R3301_13255 [Saprospiraceae bacterium]|nr:hypothetical protein [Saprospiraceae bacterium]